MIIGYFNHFVYVSTSFCSLNDYLIKLFSIKGYLDEPMSNNGHLFNEKEFIKFFIQLRHQAFHIITSIPTEKWLYSKITEHHMHHEQDGGNFVLLAASKQVKKTVLSEVTTIHNLTHNCNSVL